MEKKQTDEGVGTVLQTDEEAQWRMCVRSDGKFASTTANIVVKDSVSFDLDSIVGGVSIKDAIPTMRIALMSNTGNGLFLRTIPDRALLNESESVNSARGYSTRYLRTKHAWRDRNSIRRGDQYSSNILEVGSYVPVKVKVIAVPPDPDADRCSTWEEYELLHQSRGTAPRMSRREFEIYKY